MGAEPVPIPIRNQRLNTQAPDHQGSHLPLRLRRPARSGLPREVRAEPQARVPAHPVLCRLLAVGRLGQDAHGPAHRLRKRRAFPPEPRGRPDENARKAGQAPKALLKADKTHGFITLDSETTLAGMPPEAWDYKLGNRSALEWILDQYKEKKPKDPTIREKFNTYRFADYKEKVIDLLMRVTRLLALSHTHFKSEVFQYRYTNRPVMKVGCGFREMNLQELIVVCPYYSSE